MSRFEEYKYYDDDVRKLRQIFSNALMRYYSACHNNHGNYIEAVEKNITQKLLPTLEDLAMKDVVDGGSHYVQYVELNRQRVLNFDRYPFCNYQAVKGALGKKIGVPCEGEFNLNEEGRKVLQMIDDLRNLSLRDFSEKYYVPYVLNGLEKLLNTVEKTADWSAKKCSVCENKRVVISCLFTDKATMAAMAQFFNANDIPDFTDYNPKFVDQGLYFDDCLVKGVRLNFELERADASQPFHLSVLGCSLKSNKPRSWKFCVTDEQGKEFGERMTHNILVPEYGVTPARTTDNEPCQRSEEKVEEEKPAAAKKEHGLFGWRKKYERDEMA